ncbi:MAG: hypothetical protein QOC71_230 [Thermoplasmata archaeon]|nr:hypothetical protein [Thermoplasmata archaeon]
MAGVGAPDPSCATWPCQVRDGLFPGFAIDASFSEGDGWHRFDLEAFNDGDRSYWMSSACFFHPWAEGLIDKDGRQLEAREEPPADDDPEGCLECDVIEFAPGSILRHSAVFNETFWHPEGYAVQARAGTYTWSLSLYLWTDAECKGDGGYPLVAVQVTVALPELQTL